MLTLLFVLVDFLNFNYQVSPCSNVPPPVIMKHGTYSYFDQKMAVSFDLFVRNVKFGSLSSGTRQAVVVISCDFPIGGTAKAFAYDIHGKSAALLGEVGGANWGGDWGRGPDSIHIIFKRRFLYVDSCADDVCETSEVRTYALRGHKLQKLYARTHKTRDP